MRLFDSQVLVGDQAQDYTSASHCANPTDSGTWECDSPLNGRYVYILVEGEYINVYEMRVFGMQSLTKSAKVIRFSEPSDAADSTIKVENLVNVIAPRSYKAGWLAVDSDKNWINGIFYCYKTDSNILGP